MRERVGMHARKSNQNCPMAGGHRPVQHLLQRLSQTVKNAIHHTSYLWETPEGRGRTRPGKSA